MPASLASEAPATGEPRLPGDWRGLNADYERRFGIDHEEATPPPH